MTASKRLVYYYILEDMWNHELEKQLEKEGKLVSSGATRGKYQLTFSLKIKVTLIFYRVEELF